MAYVSGKGLRQQEGAQGEILWSFVTQVPKTQMC